MSQKEKIKQFKNFTEEQSDTVATKYLKAAKWNVETAVNSYFDSPPEASSRGSSKSSSASSSFDIAAATEWFDKYRDITLSGEKFSVDGIQQLAADVGIDPNDPVLFVFAWKCNCQQICEFTKQEFLAGLQDPNIRADNPDKLKAKIDWLRSELNDRDKFREYYVWLFSYAKDNHARHMDQSTAVSIWPMVLEGRFQYITQWTAFLEETHNKPISRDAWTQLLAFVNLTNENPTLEKYDPADSWPVVVDSFVDWMRRNGHVPNPST